MSNELLGNSDKLDSENECVNCFREVGSDYDYGMDMLLCRHCYDVYIMDGKLDTNRLSFIKHGNWKIESLQAELAEKDKANKEARELMLESVELTDFQYRKNPEYRAMELMAKHDKKSKEFLEKAKEWIEANQ